MISPSIGSAVVKCVFVQVFPTYHIYPPTAPHVAYMQPKANAPSFFMADELRQVPPPPRVLFVSIPLSLFILLVLPV